MAYNHFPPKKKKGFLRERTFAKSPYCYISRDQTFAKILHIHAKFTKVSSLKVVE